MDPRNEERKWRGSQALGHVTKLGLSPPSLPAFSPIARVFAFLFSTLILSIYAAPDSMRYKTEWRRVSFSPILLTDVLSSSPTSRYASSRIQCMEVRYSRPLKARTKACSMELRIGVNEPSDQVRVTFNSPIYLHYSINLPHSNSLYTGLFHHIPHYMVKYTNNTFESIYSI